MTLLQLTYSKAVACIHAHTHTHTKWKMANGVGLPLRGHVPPVPGPLGANEPARWHYTSWSRARNSQEH